MRQRYQYRIAYQTSTVTADGMGGGTEEWATVRTIYADIEEESGTRNLETGQVRFHKTFLIKCRIQPDLTIDGNGRFLHDGRVMVIESVLEKDKDTLEILASSND